MEKLTNKQKSKVIKKNNSKSIINRREFFKLPLSEKSEILKEHETDMFEHYKNDSEWKELQSLDNNSKETPPELSKEQLEFIEERLKGIESGEIKLMDWDDVKKKYKRFE